VDGETGAPARRRRGAELEAAIHDATWAELAEVGYARLTMERVADRARTGKQVLYRRWPNRANLVLAAIRHRFGSLADDVPDTGDLRGDVLALLRSMAQRHRDMGPDLVHGLMAEAYDVSPGSFSIMVTTMRTILARAGERGEVRVERIPARVVTLPVDLTRHQMLLSHEPIGESALTEIVDEVFLPLVQALSRS
jgi:AcrR family transcriptional regulator